MKVICLPIFPSSSLPITNKALLGIFLTVLLLNPIEVLK